MNEEREQTGTIIGVEGVVQNGLNFINVIVQYPLPMPEDIPPMMFDTPVVIRDARGKVSA